VGPPQKLKLPILSEKYVHATVVTFKKNYRRKEKHEKTKALQNL
jgi:hypothetical protein